MSVHLPQPNASDHALITQSIAIALSRIAPNWPLDQLIAVNPYWGWTDLPFNDAAKKLWSLSAAPLTMPRGYFRQQWDSGELSLADLRAALALNGDTGGSLSEAAVLEALSHTRTMPRNALLVTELIDRQRQNSVPWQHFVRHQISQHCAAYFDQSQARWRPDQDQNLFASWQWHTRSNLSPLLQLGMGEFKTLLAKLPDNALALIAAVLPATGLESRYWPDYLTALLLDINGWAACCAYQQWQAQLAGQTSEQLTELLAIRLAWDWLLIEHHPQIRLPWIAAWQINEQTDSMLNQELQINQILLHAMEHAFQKPLARQLVDRHNAPPERMPALQAAFCIDVRSERLRRALETVEPDLETLGCAGFFGLPIAYRARGSALSQPRLPGLLAPQYWASETDTSHTAATRQSLLDQQHWQELRLNPSSGFTYVETMGLKYAANLIKQSLLSGRRAQPVEEVTSAAGLTLYADAELSEPMGIEQLSQLARKILSVMGLKDHFARLFLICGHGAACVNNPHAASLACGACGGQPGLLNARVLADILNNSAVRAQLHNDGLTIPQSSWFIAGLHNTTTDTVELAGIDQVPTSHHADLHTLQTALQRASPTVRQERSAALGIAPGTSEQIAAALNKRSNDWAQVRPEWGLANNAALIIAPRSRSRALDLAGRSFLHDYQCANDSGFAVLESIMNAALIVANWINMQYYASTVDNQRMGSGSKILHNVVGQRLGVFEGNGGDLRIGLPWQSVHDGHELRHTPLRLSVFIEAPREAIDAIIAKHCKLGQLVANGWLHLFQIDAENNQIHTRRNHNWTLFVEAPPITG